MRILYCALDQRVPGTLGGSVHVQAVAEGLAALGHEVHTITGGGDGPVATRARCTGTRCARRPAALSFACCVRARYGGLPERYSRT